MRMSARARAHTCVCACLYVFVCAHALVPLWGVMSLMPCVSVGTSPNEMVMFCDDSMDCSMWIPRPKRATSAKAFGPFIRKPGLQNGSNYRG